MCLFSTYYWPRKALFSNSRWSTSKATQARAQDIHAPDYASSRPLSESRGLVCAACQSTVFSFAGFHAAWTAQSSESDPYTYNVKMKDVQASAARGCNWCSLLVPELAAAKESESKFGIHSIGVTRGPFDRAEDTFIIKVKFGTASAGEDSFPLADTPRGLQKLHIQVNEVHIGTGHHVCAEASDIASKHITARAAAQARPEEHFDHARESLRVCTALSPGHENCVAPRRGVLPTRVIDCMDPSRPKLHVSQSERAFYAALSYVWGEDQPRKTTSHNVSVYASETGLDPVHIPQTILDAISVVKALGLRFLWVDAYCIIQDDDKDKQTEIANMRNIYRNAYITLIAANASRVSAGFLKSGDAHPSAVRLPFICPDGKAAGTMFIHEPVFTSLSDDPVNSRAWCLEELLLSPRALIFSRTLQYSCVSQSPITLGGRPETHQNVRLEAFMFRSDAVTPSLEQEIALRNRWNAIITEYTRRNLTHEKDRLIAFGAVAEEFGRFWKDSRYTAGVWSHNLLEDLLWSKGHVTGESLPSRPAEYRAPTWSWASVNGAVWTAERMNLLWPARCRYLCETIRCDATLKAGSKPFGQVTGGVLELQASLIEVIWNPANSTLSLKGLEGDTNIATRSAYRDCDEEASQKDMEVCALPIRRCKGAGFDSIDGILVVPLGELESSYRRVGSFVIGTLLPKAFFDPEAWIAGPTRKVTIV